MIKEMSAALGRDCKLCGFTRRKLAESGGKDQSVKCSKIHVSIIHGGEGGGCVFVCVDKHKRFLNSGKQINRSG